MIFELGCCVCVSSVGSPSGGESTDGDGDVYGMQVEIVELRQELEHRNLRIQELEAQV